MNRPSSKTQQTLFKPKLLVPVALLGLAALLGGKAYWTERHEGVEAQAPTSTAQPNHLTLAEDASQLNFLKMEAATVADLPASEPLNARLTLSDDNTARVFAPLAGRLIRLQANIGDAVKQGAELAVIDAPDFGQAIADLRKAEIAASQRDKSLTRARILFEGDAMSRRELEATEADSRAALAEVERARLRLSNLAPSGSRIEGERLVLRAPLSGLVVDRQANPGTEVRPDSATPLFVISDTRQLWLNIDLPEKALAAATPGAVVNFTVDAYTGESFTAKVERVGAMVDPATRRIPVRAVVQNADGRLKPEMFARATLGQAKADPVVKLPVSALLTTGLTTQVFVQTGPRDFERRTVKVLRQDNQSAYLDPSGNVHAGDKVVIRGTILLASEMTQGE